MSKHGQAIENQIDAIIDFMEVSLLHRRFTSAEATNMREAFYTVVHTAQSEVVGAVAETLTNELNEDNRPLVCKLATLLKSF